MGGRWRAWEGQRYDDPRRDTDDESAYGGKDPRSQLLVPRLFSLREYLHRGEKRGRDHERCAEGRDAKANPKRCSGRPVRSVSKEHCETEERDQEHSETNGERRVLASDDRRA